MSITKISTIDMDHETWLEYRRKSIGGSDAAAIAGLSKYASPLSVWADKTGRLGDIQDTEAMRQGRDLEDYVARRWVEETGKEVEPVPAIMYNSDYPFAHANVDRWVIGENEGLECKTTSTLDLKQFEGVEFPEKYYAQCVHYMAVTGADAWNLAVLIFGRDFKVWKLERDEKEIKALMDMEQEFWKYIERDEPPPVDGLDATRETINNLYSGKDGDIELFGRAKILDERETLCARKKEIIYRLTEIENTIKMDMGECTRAHCDGYTVTWCNTKRGRTFKIKKVGQVPHG